MVTLFSNLIHLSNYRKETHTASNQRSPFCKPAALHRFIIGTERMKKEMETLKGESRGGCLSGGVYRRSVKRSKTDEEDDNSRCQLLSEENLRDLTEGG